MKKFILAFLLICNQSFSAEYYVKVGGSAENTGLSDEQAFALPSQAAAVLSDYDTVNINGGDVFRDKFAISNLDHITLQSYGTGVPEITGFAIEDDPWLQYGATDIYYASNYEDGIKIVMEDRELNAEVGLLTYIDWDTDIATTAAGMSSGTWTCDEDNDLLYVQTLDDSDPSDNVIEYTDLDRPIETSNCDYFTMQDIKVSGGKTHNILHGLYPYQSQYTCDYGYFDNIVDIFSGGRGTRFNGDYNVHRYFDTSYYNPPEKNSIDVSGVVFYGVGNITEYSHFHNSLWGSAIEFNGLSTNQTGTTANIARYCTSDSVTQQFLEIWYSSGNEAYGNYDYNTGQASYKLTNGSSNNKIYNGISIVPASNSTLYSIYRIGYSGDTVKGADNEFYNMTAINHGTRTGFGCIEVRDAGYLRNTFKNMLVVSDNNQALNIKDNTTILENNSYYTTSEGDFITWMDVTYSKAQFLTYQSASGQDSNSITSDPQIRADGHLKSTSPCINAGTDVGVDTDYDGDPRDASPDIGAYEYKSLRASGVTMSGLN